MKAKYIVKQENGVDWTVGQPTYETLKVFKHKPEALDFVKNRNYMKLRLEEVTSDGVKVYDGMTGEFV